MAPSISPARRTTLTMRPFDSYNTEPVDDTWLRSRPTTRLSQSQMNERASLSLSPKKVAYTLTPKTTRPSRTPTTPYQRRMSSTHMTGGKIQGEDPQRTVGHVDHVAREELSDSDSDSDYTAKSSPGPSDDSEGELVPEEMVHSESDPTSAARDIPERGTAAEVVATGNILDLLETQIAESSLNSNDAMEKQNQALYQLKTLFDSLPPGAGGQATMAANVMSFALQVAKVGKLPMLDPALERSSVSNDDGLGDFIVPDGIDGSDIVRQFFGRPRHLGEKYNPLATVSPAEPLTHTRFTWDIDGDWTADVCNRWLAAFEAYVVDQIGVKLLHYTSDLHYQHRMSPLNAMTPEQRRPLRALFEVLQTPGHTRLRQVMRAWAPSSIVTKLEIERDLRQLQRELTNEDARMALYCANNVGDQPDSRTNVVADVWENLSMVSYFHFFQKLTDSIVKGQVDNAIGGRAPTIALDIMHNRGRFSDHSVDDSDEMLFDDIAVSSQGSAQVKVSFAAQSRANLKRKVAFSRVAYTVARLFGWATLFMMPPSKIRTIASKINNTRFEYLAVIIATSVGHMWRPWQGMGEGLLNTYFSDEDSTFETTDWPRNPVSLETLVAYIEGNTGLERSLMTFEETLNVLEAGMKARESKEFSKS